MLSLDSELYWWLRWYKLWSSFFLNATHEIILHMANHNMNFRCRNDTERVLFDMVWWIMLSVFGHCCLAMKQWNNCCDQKRSGKDSAEQQTNKQRMYFLKWFSLRVLQFLQTRWYLIFIKKLVKILPKAINFIHHALPLFLINPFN